MKDFEKCEINVTLVNGQKMKCELKGLVNMNMQGRETVKLTKALYVPQVVKKLLIISRLVSKGATVEATQEKISTKKTDVSMIIDARKGKNENMML